MHQLTHLASRIFGVPLLIERQKLDVILGALGPRIGVVSEDEAADTQPKAYGPGDTGRSRKSYFVTEDKIAIIDVVGPLVKRASGDFISGGPTTYTEIENEFTDAVTDPEIKGVLLQVDSPGGESVGAFELSDLIYSQRSAKPIFAVADGDAFSAAYALASAAEQLYVTKSGGVGSVGVWMMHIDQSAFNEQKGIKPTYLYAGARKIDGNPHAPLSEGARNAFQAEVDRIYGMFTDAVARNRGMSGKSVRSTEAGLFFGQNSIDVGFADQIGGLSDALAGLRAAISSKSSLSAAASAAPIPQKGGIVMDEPTIKADAEQQPPKQEAGALVSVEEMAATQIAAARPEALAYAADVAEYCVLAGMPAKIAGFLRASTSIEDVRKELMTARAASDSEEKIHSHVLPESGTETGKPAAKTNVEESPIVRAASALAGKEK